MKLSIFILVLVTICLNTNCGNARATSPKEEKRFSDKVNLALRQTGHHLLTIQGDAHSTVPPIQQASPDDFVLELNSTFDYDTLPYLIDHALSDFSIHRDYQVVVEACDEDLTILGYNRTSFQKGQMACRGRDQTSSCNRIKLSFEPARTSFIAANGFMILSSFLAGGIVVGLLLFFRQKSEEPIANKQSESEILLGNFHFDHQNQSLRLGDNHQALTFRESKLLHFLAGRPNEVLTRDTLIAEVWGDEGVIVGRSLDVFISRLRKFLKVDDSVAIKTIHGVGYKLEV